MEWPVVEVSVHIGGQVTSCKKILKLPKSQARADGVAGNSSSVDLRAT